VVIDSKLYFQASVLAVLLTAPANAGPPFVTDDPEPTDYGHFEIYAFTQGLSAEGSKSGTALGLEVNYGLVPDVQVSVSLPVGFSAPNRSRPRFGITDAEFGVKYRFMSEDKEGWRPQVSFYPSIDGAIATRNFGDNETHEFFPIWAQKSFGPWTAFGGGGYRINPGRDGVNSGFEGATLLRQISERFSAGVELYHESAQAHSSGSVTGIDVGALYDFNKALHVVASAGPQGGALWNGRTYYVALEWTT
jgi:outer membrane putative beta-barrel porin/alpha-amylase